MKGRSRRPKPVTCTRLARLITKVQSPSESAARSHSNDGLDGESTGTVAIAMGGTVAGQYGSLSVTSDANLSGTLDVSLVNGYSPQVNDSIPIITFDTLSGQFNTRQRSEPSSRNCSNPGLRFDEREPGIWQRSDGRWRCIQSTGCGDELLPATARLRGRRGIRRWDAAGASPTELSALMRPQVQVAKLPDAESNT